MGQIEKSWNEAKGLVGIYIHRLKNGLGVQGYKGENPFEDFTMDRDKSKLSAHAKAYDPPFADSKQVYDYIAKNLENWVEEAIRIRANY